MARKKSSSNSNSAQDPLFVAAIIIIILLYLAPLAGKIGIILLLLAAAALYVARFRARIRLLESSGIADIDKMGGKAFELRMELLFRSLGYQVEPTPYVGDFGADLILTKDGVRTVVQAKRYTKKVDQAAIREAVAAKAKYGCGVAMVVTNSVYTPAAKELARHNHVVLWDRQQLLQQLIETRSLS